MSTTFPNFSPTFLQKYGFWRLCAQLFFCLCGTELFVFFQQRFQVLAGKALRHCSHLFRGTLGHDEAAGTAALGAQINDMVGALDEVEVVLDDNDRIARVHQLLRQRNTAHAGTARPQ